MTNKYLIIITLCVACFCSSESQDPTVGFSNTTVQGIRLQIAEDRYIDKFMGIPYAEPPIGNLRFRNPVPKLYSDASFLANVKKPRCVDRVERFIKGFENEDCLYLNVYRPQSLDNQSLPVMVYFQAADIIRRDYDEPKIEPDYLLRKDIVLVTLTYRMGVFSFFSTGDEQAPGNLGLKDQKLALQWVQTNIAAFNGDPNRVTLFGNGDAAESIHYHTLVDHTEGLFHRYILQSGTALGPHSICDSRTRENMATQLADDLECPSFFTWRVVVCLQKIETSQLLHTSLFRIKKMDLALLKTWSPTKEAVGPDAFLTECPLDLFARNQQRNLPFIAGVAGEEYLPVSTTILSETGYDWEGSWIRVRQIVESVLRSPDLIESVNEFYFEDILYNKTSLYSDDDLTLLEHHNVDDEYRWHMILTLGRLLHDVYFLHPAIRVLEQQRKNSYFYHFNFKGSCSMVDYYIPRGTGLVESTHGDELLYLFPCDPLHFPDRWRPTPTPDDYVIIESMVELWTSFATDGVPRSSRLGNWPPYDSEGHYLKIGDSGTAKISLESNLQSEEMRFWGNATLQMCD